MIIPKSFTCAFVAALVSITDAFSPITRITPSGLKPGDILVWETGSTKLEELVALLSGDDYSHAAIVSGNNKVFEQVQASAQEIDFMIDDETRFNRRITVTRLEGIDVNAVLDAAREDVNAAVPYSFSGLGALAVLLFLNDPLIIKGSSKSVIDALKEFIGAVTLLGGFGIEKGESTFCSQFVYKCFDEADTTLEIRSPVLSRTHTEGKTLLDCCIEDISNKEEVDITDEEDPVVPSISTSSSTDGDVMIEDSAAILLKALKEEGSETIASATDKIDKELLSAVIKYALCTERVNLPESLSKKERVLTALGNMCKKSMVTPGELTRIANKNAVFLGSFEINR